MRVIIHAGMQKTGSSALQEYLASNRSGLRKIKVVYPDLDHRSHWMLAAALTDPAENRYLKRRVDDQNVDQVRANALDIVGAAIAEMRDDEVLLISHESFSLEPHMTNLRAFLEHSMPSPSIDVIAYARNPVSHFPSGLQQRVKSRNRALTSPSSWVSTHFDRGLMLQAAFGDRVTIRAHSKETLVNGDIIADFRTYFASVIGHELPVPETEISTNSSLSAPACAILQRYKAIALNDGDDDFNVVRRLLLKFDEDQPKRSLVLGEEWKRNIALNNQDGWNSLVRLMSHGEDVKSSLSIDYDTRNQENVSIEEVIEWLQSLYDSRYTEEFAKFCRSVARTKRGKAMRVADWVDGYRSAKAFASNRNESVASSFHSSATIDAADQRPI